MLNPVSNQDLINNTGIQQQQELQKIAAGKYMSNPINEKNMLVDGYDFSSEALSMYQREQEIKQFTNLALSDPEDTSHEDLVATKIQNNEIASIDDDNIWESIINNSQFLQDLGE